MTEIARMIAQINPTIAAALIALLGGLLALAWNRRENRRQEFHDLRRDIYLEAAEAYSAMITYMNSMSSHLVTSSQGQLVLERLLKCSAKIHLVAERRVIESTVALIGNLITSFNDLSRIKAQSEDLLREINRKIPVIQDGKKLTFAPPTGTNSRELVEVVIQLEKENTSAAAQVHSLAWQMIDTWTERYSGMAPLVSQAVLAVKDELKISVDHDWYSQMTTDVFAEDTRRRIELLAALRPVKTDQPAPASALVPSRPRAAGGPPPDTENR